MPSKASRILGIEDADKLLTGPSTGQQPQPSRSLFGISKTKKKSVQPTSQPQTSQGTSRGVSYDEMDIDSNSDEMEIQSGLKRRPTEPHESSPMSESHESMSARFRSASVSSIISNKSRKASMSLGVRETEVSRSRRPSALSNMTTHAVEPDTEDYPAPTLPQLNTASPNTTSFADDVMHGMPGAYPQSPPDASAPQAPVRPKRTPVALALQQMSIIDLPPTPPPKDTPPDVPLTPSTPRSARSPRSPLAVVQPNILNTFVTSQKVYIHGPIVLRNKRKSTSINTLAGWAWEDDEMGIGLFSNTEEMVAEALADEFGATFARLCGEDDWKNSGIEEIWNKEWLAAPVLDQSLILSSAARQAEVEAEEAPLRNDYPMHRRTTSTLSGSTRFSGASKSPISGNPRFSGSSRPKSAISTKSMGSSGGGPSPTRKSWEKKSGYGSKTQDGLKELWFRRGLF